MSVRSSIVRVQLFLRKKSMAGDWVVKEMATRFGEEEPTERMA